MESCQQQENSMVKDRFLYAQEVKLKSALKNLGGKENEKITKSNSLIRESQKQYNKSELPLLKKINGRHQEYP